MGNRKILQKVQHQPKQRKHKSPQTQQTLLSGPSAHSLQPTGSFSTTSSSLSCPPPHPLVFPLFLFNRFLTVVLLPYTFKNVLFTYFSLLGHPFAFLSPAHHVYVSLYYTCSNCYCCFSKTNSKPLFIFILLLTFI